MNNGLLGASRRSEYRPPERARVVSAIVETAIHRLRNPLAGASATLQILQQGSGVTPQQKLTVIEQELERVNVGLSDLEAALCYRNSMPQNVTCSIRDLPIETEQDATCIGECGPIASLIAMFQQLATVIPVNVEVDLDDSHVHITIGRIASVEEKSLTTVPPPARSTGGNSLMVSAAITLVHEYQGELRWSGDLDNPNPFVLSLKRTKEVSA
jgi:signal transduction histidine kinase